MHAAYLFIVSGHFPLKSFRTSNMQPVTFAPSFKHISGSWFPFLHAKYAAVWFAHLFCKCLCEANKTLDVGALSFSDMIFLLNSATKLYYTHKQQQQRSDCLRFSRLKKRYSFLSLSLSLSINTGVRSQNTLSLSLHTLSLYTLYTLSFFLSLSFSLSNSSEEDVMMMTSALSSTLFSVRRKRGKSTRKFRFQKGSFFRKQQERKHNEQHTLHSSKRLVDVLFVDMGTKTKPTSSSSSDTTPRADSSAEKTSSKSSSFSLEPIVKPKIKWSAADLPEISPVAPFLISEDEREAGAASSKQSS